MAKTLALPAVTLVADDVPDNVRAALDTFNQARDRAGDLGAQLDRLGWTDERRGKIAEEHEAALTETAEAHAQLSNATIVHGRAVADFASVQFVAHVQRVRELLAEAEAEARAAAGSAALAATAATRAGRPVLNTEGSAARGSEARQQAMHLAAVIRDVAANLPEGVD